MRPASSDFIRASTAIFGLAVAIAISPRLQLAAAAGDLPGALQSEGLSPRGPLLQWIALVVFPFLGALAARWVIPKLEESQWASVAYCVAMASAPLPLMHYGNLRHVVLHGLMAAAIVAARRIDPHFEKRDVVLIPVLLSMHLALLDIGFGKTPAATFVRAAMIIFALRVAVRSTERMTLAPLALVFQMLELPPWVAILWIFGGTFFRVRTPMHAVALPAYVLALLGLFSPPPVAFFEDGHDLLPASEMLRGELPYRDVLPMHGIVSDGGLSWLVFATGNDDIGSALAVRRAVSALNLTAIYFVAVAATGSAEAGLLAGLLTIAFFPASTIGIRTIPALFALAAACASVRMESRRWLWIATTLCAVGFAVSIDFAIYSSLVVLAVALWTRAWKAAATIVLLLVAAVIAFWSLLAEANVYVIGRLGPPECLRNLSAMAAFSSDPHCFSAIVWLLALIFAAVTLAGRLNPAAVIAMWVVVAGLSYVERRHLYYEFAVAPLLMAWLWMMKRRVVLAILLVILARPFAHVFDVATRMQRESEREANPVAAFPRTQGGFFDEHARRGLESAARFPLRPGETFYDFANAPILYYLMERDCPIPWPEVPLYESHQAQRKVIETLERNRKIRAVLTAFPGSFPDIDGIHNRSRAPMVWTYIEKNFQPAFNENGVEFWTRRDRREVSAPSAPLR